jgi:hypothetical protein
VSGGNEYDFVPPTRRLEAGAVAEARGAAPGWLRALGRGVPLGATRLQERFNLGLDIFTLYIDFVFDVTNEKSTYQVILPVLPFLRQATAAAAAGDAEYGNIVKLNGAKITDVRGLLIAALVFQSFAWAGLALASYALVAPKYSTTVAATVRVCTPAAAFFVFLAVCVFDASGANADFCSALNPDARSDGLPCG